MTKTQDALSIGLKALVFVLALWISGGSLLGVLDPDIRSPIFQSLMTTVSWAGYAHVLGGSFALIFGGIQLSSSIRRRNIGLHKLVGNVYVACVMISTVGAIVSLLESQTGWAAKLGFWMLAIGWPIVTLAGYPRQGKFDAGWHGKLMFYSYAMTCSAISLRLYLGILMATGIDFQIAYPIAAWSCWIGNVILAFAVLNIASRKKRQHSARYRNNSSIQRQTSR